jgi:hypothetical protein
MTAPGAHSSVILSDVVIRAARGKMYFELNACISALKWGNGHREDTFLQIDQDPGCASSHQAAYKHLRGMATGESRNMRISS